MLRQALILAGGRGTRLGALTDAVPKPMLPVAGRPFLEHLIRNLRRFGVDRIVLSVGYLAQAFEAHFGDGGALGVSIAYSHEAAPLGTGGGVRHALPLLDDAFLVLNGDTLFDCNYLDLALLLGQAGGAPGAALALRRVDDASRYGSVRLDGDRVAGFAEKSQAGPGLISAGVYALTRRVVEELPPGASSIETDLFPRLADRGALAARAYPGFFIDIGLPETLAFADRAIPDWQRKPCVFFDRDGVLNTDFGYVHRPQDFQWTEDAIEAVKWCNDCGYLVVVTTNQAGIARGYYDAAAFHGLMDWMRGELRRHGAHLDAVYHCPHHPTAGQGELGCVCDCRKPAGGMVRQAIEDWTIDAARSVLIGDKPSDISAGECCGVAGHLFTGGSLLAMVRECVAPLREA
ncbi:MAG: HAD-IIIA family hydrolase [Desulfovibrionaceae bacterium]